MIKEDFVSAIRNRNAARICYLLLGADDPPRIVRGAGTENELWDYKADVPTTAAGWARIARHVLAFHNNRGGALLFGIRDGDLGFCGASSRADSKIFNDKIRRYVGDQIWVDFHREWISRISAISDWQSFPHAARYSVTSAMTRPSSTANVRSERAILQCGWGTRRWS